MPLTAAADDEAGLALRVRARVVVGAHTVHVHAETGEGWRAGRHCMHAVSPAVG